MDNEALNLKLYEKLLAEQEEYKGWLCKQPPEEILKHAHEYTVREDIVYAMEYHDLSDEQASALLESPTPLAEIYRDFEQIEGDHMDVIRGCIETRANDLIEEKASALRTLEVYAETAAYAKEHSEYHRYRDSLQANILCRTAIEDAIKEHYHENRLHSKGAKSVLEKFGAERTCYVLAATVQDKDWDERISAKNKAWAKNFFVSGDTTAWNTNAYRCFVVSGSHPGLVDLFVNQVRREVEQMKERKPSVLQKLQDMQATDIPKSVKSRKKEAER